MKYFIVLEADIEPNERGTAMLAIMQRLESSELAWRDPKEHPHFAKLTVSSVGAFDGSAYQAAREIRGLINVLRSEEGDSVTINSQNPEGNPNQAIDCSGAWTKWTDRRFTGDTLLDALRKAASEKAKFTRPVIVT